MPSSKANMSPRSWANVIEAIYVPDVGCRPIPRSAVDTNTQAINCGNLHYQRSQYTIIDGPNAVSSTPDIDLEEPWFIEIAISNAMYHADSTYFLVPSEVPMADTARYHVEQTTRNGVGVINHTYPRFINPDYAPQDDVEQPGEEMLAWNPALHGGRFSTQFGSMTVDVNTHHRPTCLGGKKIAVTSRKSSMTSLTSPVSAVDSQGYASTRRTSLTSSTSQQIKSSSLGTEDPNESSETFSDATDILWKVNQELFGLEAPPTPDDAVQYDSNSTFDTSIMSAVMRELNGAESDLAPDPVIVKCHLKNQKPSVSSVPTEADEAFFHQLMKPPALDIEIEPHSTSLSKIDVPENLLSYVKEKYGLCGEPCWDVRRIFPLEELCLQASEEQLLRIINDVNVTGVSFKEAVGDCIEHRQDQESTSLSTRHMNKDQSEETLTGSFGVGTALAGHSRSKKGPARIHSKPTSFNEVEETVCPHTEPGTVGTIDAALLVYRSSSDASQAPTLAVAHQTQEHEVYCTINEEDTPDGKSEAAVAVPDSQADIDEGNQSHEATDDNAVQTVAGPSADTNELKYLTEPQPNNSFVQSLSTHASEIVSLPANTPGSSHDSTSATSILSLNLGGSFSKLPELPDGQLKDFGAEFTRLWSAGSDGTPWISGQDEFFVQQISLDKIKAKHTWVPDNLIPIFNELNQHIGQLTLQHPVSQAGPPGSEEANRHMRKIEVLARAMFQWPRFIEMLSQDLVFVDKLASHKPKEKNRPQLATATYDNIQEHHLNFLGDKVYCRSATSPATSFWAMNTTLKNFIPVNQRINGGVSISVVLASQAWKYVDPIVYSGQGFSSETTGSELEEMVKGDAEKVYVPQGTWVDDCYGHDDHFPRVPEEGEYINFATKHTPGYLHRPIHLETIDKIGFVPKRVAQIPVLKKGSPLREVTTIEDLHEDKALEKLTVEGIDEDNTLRNLTELEALSSWANLTPAIGNRSSENPTAKQASTIKKGYSFEFYLL